MKYAVYTNFNELTCSSKKQVLMCRCKLDLAAGLFSLHCEVVGLIQNCLDTLQLHLLDLCDTLWLKCCILPMPIQYYFYMKLICKMF